MVISSIISRKLSSDKAWDQQSTRHTWSPPSWSSALDNFPLPLQIHVSPFLSLLYPWGWPVCTVSKSSYVFLLPVAVGQCTARGQQIRGRQESNVGYLPHWLSACLDCPFYRGLPADGFLYVVMSLNSGNLTLLFSFRSVSCKSSPSCYSWGTAIPFLVLPKPLEIVLLLNSFEIT